MRSIVLLALSLVACGHSLSSIAEDANQIAEAQDTIRDRWWTSPEWPFLVEQLHRTMAAVARAARSPHPPRLMTSSLTVHVTADSTAIEYDQKIDVRQGRCFPWVLDARKPVSDNPTMNLFDVYSEKGDKKLDTVRLRDTQQVFSSQVLKVVRWCASADPDVIKTVSRTEEERHAGVDPDFWEAVDEMDASVVVRTFYAVVDKDAVKSAALWLEVHSDVGEKPVSIPCTIEAADSYSDIAPCEEAFCEKERFVCRYESRGSSILFYAIRGIVWRDQ